MKTIVLIQFLLTSVMASSQTLREQILVQNPEAEGIIITKCKIDPALFIVIVQRAVAWWEDISIVKFKDGKILWTAKFDTLPTSQSILSARQISLPGFKNPLIEIFDVTHHGNGFYYLYELKGKNLKLMVSTIAVDDHDDYSYVINNEYYSRFFKNGKLKPIYTDTNKDGYVDIKLVGTIQMISNDHSKEYYAQKILVYSKTKNRFIEDLKRRRGFKKDDS